MAEKKKKLNKGLDAIFGGDITSLIDDIEHNTPESSQEKIKLDEIRPNPYQPRKVFDEQALNELALSTNDGNCFIRKYSKRRFKCHRRSTSLSNDDGKT